MRSKIILNGVLLIVPFIAPLALSVSTASASETVTPHSISSTYSKPAQVTTANGSMWYVETDSSGNNDIGNMTTSGTTTDYAIMPSGETSMDITGLTTGPDGNVWFDGCASTSSSSWTVEAGYLNVSTGVVTFYPNTLIGTTASCIYNGTNAPNPGAIAAGPDGYIWYVVNSHGGSGYTNIFSVDPSTGATANAWSKSSQYFVVNSLAAGSDGRLWVTNDVTGDYSVYAFTVSGGREHAVSFYDSGWAAGNIIAGPDGNLWLIRSGQIAKMTTSGTLTTYSPGSGVSPQTLATGPDGAVWFTAGVSGALDIGRMTTSGSTTLYATGGSTSNYPGITLGPDNAMWFSYKTSGTDSLGRIGY